MIYGYGVTVQGSYHIEHGTVCQDAHRIAKCSDHMAIAAVADGLGSEDHSEIASRLAADTAVEYLAANLAEDSDKQTILGCLRESFRQAQAAIESEAEKNGHDPDQYDTTLSLAVLVGESLYFGQAGDSGIIAQTMDGLFIPITEQQRDEESRVFPLVFGEEKWAFGMADTGVASVFLATDGIFERLFPVYIRDEAVSIHVSLIRYFADNRKLHIDEIGEEEVQRRIERFIESIPGSQINDDKTVAVLVNTAASPSLQPPEYYAEPDWQALKQKYEEKWRRQAYPHLYQGESG